MVTYRVIGTQTLSCVRHVAFEGSLEALKRNYPIESFPRPLNRHVEDIQGGRGGTLMFSLERAEVETVSQRERPHWERISEDPRFS